MFVFWILFIYAAVVMLAYIFQDRLIYLPSRSDLESVRTSSNLLSLKLWPQDDGNYKGFLPEEDPEVVKGTIVVFHGNAGSAVDRIYYVQPLQKLGYRVLLAEYPGYGARTGKMGQQSFVDDGLDTVRKAGKEFGGPVYLWGESLGCGVATAVAADKTIGIKGAVLLTPWNTLPATAQAHYWFLPARWFVRDQFDNVWNLKEFTEPVAVLMADKDDVIPNRLTMALYDSITARKRLWTFNAAGHNNWPTDPELDWWREVMDFITEKRPAPDL
ncbi:MAG: alpha/beta fold hydrolase [Acidobacteriota bacterium]